MRVRAVGSLLGDEWATATFEKHRSKVNLAAVISRKCSGTPRDSDGNAFALWTPIVNGLTQLIPKIVQGRWVKWADFC